MPHVVSQFTDQGSNPHSLQWNCGVLTTGLPGKFPSMTSVIHVLLSPTKKKFVKLSYFGNIYIIYKYDMSDLFPSPLMDNSINSQRASFSLA